MPIDGLPIFNSRTAKTWTRILSLLIVLNALSMAYIWFYEIRLNRTTFGTLLIFTGICLVGISALNLLTSRPPTKPKRIPYTIPSPR